MRETVGTKVIKWFYGIRGPLDEYRRNEINRIGNNIAIFLLMFNLLLAFIASLIILATDNYEFTLSVVVGSMLFVVFGIYIYIIYEIEHHRLARVDIDAKQVVKTKKKIFKKAIGLGAYFAVGMYCLNILTDWLPDRGSIVPLLTERSRVIEAIIMGIYFGAAMMLVDFHHIKKNPERIDGRASSIWQQQKRWSIICIILIVAALFAICLF